MKLLIAAIIAFTSLPAFAVNKPDQKQVERFNKRIMPVYSAMEGVNGFGIASCVSETGAPVDYNSEDPDPSALEPCSLVYTQTREAEAALLALLPANTRISGVLIAVNYIGIVRPQ